MRAVFFPAGVGFVFSNPHWEHSRNKQRNHARKISTYGSPPPLIRVLAGRLWITVRRWTRSELLVVLWQHLKFLATTTKR